MSTSVEYKPEWIREDFIDFIAEKINPVWALKKVKACVVEIQALSPDFYKIHLRPNQNFQAQRFQAGQSILVTLAMNGVRQQRSYSIVTLLDNGDVILVIKRQGKMSNALTQLPAGAVVELSQPQGNFVLPAPVPSLCFIASGSGITAIYSLLQKAVVSSTQPIDLLYFTRDDAFHAEIKTLALMYPYFKYHHFNTVEQHQHLSLSLLQNTVEQLGERHIYACGSASMMQAAQQICQQLDLSEQFHSEYFQMTADENLEAQPVQFLRSQQDFQANSNLLDSAEAAGLRPAHGCRMGICNTCSCTKVSGSVRNLLTGEIDHNHNTQIKLCVTQAISPVVINL
ncbi:flavin reductase family protein [Acinetobacter indicus]|uniref:flavin reductase family protein n=1 Tax=Acinetobacter indicus TaxID=756892 RepID=UPI0012E2CAAC|nr:iron-sulfur cluster-binding domain-containing protein [Acinetobacter indicus]